MLDKKGDVWKRIIKGLGYKQTKKNKNKNS